ncbi:MAG: hypothetical protein ACRCVN_00675 [Spirochaetia bacterium]
MNKIKRAVYRCIIFSFLCSFLFLSSSNRGYEEALEYLLEEEKDPMTDCQTKTPNDLLVNRRNFSLDGDLPGLIRPSIRILFQRYIHGLLNANIPLILTVTADTLDFPHYSSSMTKDMQYEFFSELFATYAFAEVKFENLYCLNSGKITLFDGERGMLSVRSRDKAPDPLKNWHYWEGFWGIEHYYFFEKIDHKWKLIAFDIAERESVL